MFYRFIFWIGFLIFNLHLYSQDLKSSFEALSEGDQRSIEAIALYPEDIRLAVLEIASRPVLLIRLKRLQEESRQAFALLIGAYPKETQDIVWNLTRFPSVIKSIAAYDLTTDILHEIRLNFPPEVVTKVETLTKEELELIRQVVHLQVETEEAAMALYSSEPTIAKESVQKLFDHPEILSTMCDEVELAILVGNQYLTNREWLLKKVDSLNLVLAVENAKALQDWKSNLEQDEVAQRELRSSWQEYENEYPFDDVYYEGGNDVIEDLSLSDDMDIRISPYFHFHYPFWFGYPYWYDYPRWRPFPIWYDWGFYPIPGSIIVINLPRYHIVWWYLNQPHHHYKYAHLSSKFIQYYQTHREFGGGVTAAVSNWRTKNREIITDEFIANRDQLPKNLRIYGQMEENRTNYNLRKPQDPLSSTEYLNKYEQKYKSIRTDPDKIKVEKQPVTQQRIIQDLKRTPGRTKEIEREKVNQPERIRDIEKANENHREKVVRKPETQTPSARPSAPQTSPRKKTVDPSPRKNVPRKTSEN